MSEEKRILLAALREFLEVKLIDPGATRYVMRGCVDVCAGVRTYVQAGDRGFVTSVQVIGLSDVNRRIAGPGDERFRDGKRYVVDVHW